MFYHRNGVNYSKYGILWKTKLIDITPTVNILSDYKKINC